MSRKPQLYEAWFECGCTKIAPLREIVEYCPDHGLKREALVTYSEFIEPAQNPRIKA